MIFDSRTYSALIVSSSEKLSAQISSMLSSISCYPIVSVCSVSAAKRELLEKTYDFVIINSPLPDDTGIRLALDANNNSTTISLLLLKAEDYEDVEARVSTEGVFSIAKPLTAQRFSIALNWLKAARERIRKVEKKAATLEDKMEEIRLINRAKWVLIEKESLTEDAAHKSIEKQAMDACATKVEIAKIIIGKYSL